ncbi:alkaline phosphatase-like protein [Conidiobolus coronatus NRRL 28638]|uniref:Alkaline phosphatase-like protein n=1 Tax=Conidiobolus coronatus (strain ATCC 28846 / CBS 209.66 / NRRL 28638) TaxID=796925 RepID=A0A137NUN1_CONC2|nr:alkaline phosphatase-like protein [Conidiobolus coronatus NRRL 28638]|eukprot:KXN66457.1 alkaline phosphatase-like protein [Conidiobolus coronatus NRRL 28638]
MRYTINFIYLLNLIAIIYCKKIERVLFLGLDGAGSFHTKIDTPNVDRLLKSGIYCDYASAMDPTMSGENWGSMLHGVIPSKHGLNNDIADNYPYPEDSPYPSIFKIIYQQDPKAKMASFARWPAINTGIIELSVPMHRVSNLSDDDNIGPMLKYLRANGTDSKLMYFYFGDIDNAGHNMKWMTPIYKINYKKVDAYIGLILDALDVLNIRDTTLVIIAADHGGIGYGHGGTIKFERNVLFGISGPNINTKKLHDNAVRNMDAAAIILKSLNYQIPDYFDAKYPKFQQNRNIFVKLIYRQR